MARVCFTLHQSRSAFETGLREQGGTEKTAKYHYENNSIHCYISSGSWLFMNCQP
jgi:hypothetical protein